MVKLRVFRSNKCLGFLAVEMPEDNQEFVKLNYYAPKYKKNKSIVFRTAIDSSGEKFILAGKCTDKTLTIIGLSNHG